MDVSVSVRYPVRRAALFVQFGSSPATATCVRVEVVVRNSGPVAMVAFGVPDTPSRPVFRHQRRYPCSFVTV